MIMNYFIEQSFQDCTHDKQKQQQQKVIKNCLLGHSPTCIMNWDFKLNLNIMGWLGLVFTSDYIDVYEKPRTLKPAV